MTVVLGLDPAFFPVMRFWMRNFAITDGRTFTRIAYPNVPNPLPFLDFAGVGVSMLDKALHCTPGRKIVFGHSMGSQVAYKWLREKGPTSDICPADVVFVLGGNPERKYGGTCVVQSPPRKLFGSIAPKAAYGGCGLPEDTHYRVIDYVRQYDGWADVPTVECPSRESLGAVSDGYHLDYLKAGLFDPDVLTYTEGSVTYALKPTALKRESDRDVIECGFERPDYRCEPVRLWGDA